MIRQRTSPDIHQTRGNQQTTSETEYSPRAPSHLLPLHTSFPSPEPTTPPLHLNFPPRLLNLPHLPTQPFIPSAPSLLPHRTFTRLLLPFPTHRHLPPRLPKRTHSSLALRCQHLFERHSRRDVRERRENDGAKGGRCRGAGGGVWGWRDGD